MTHRPGTRHAASVHAGVFGAEHVAVVAQSEIHQTLNGFEPARGKMQDIEPHPLCLSLPWGGPVLQQERANLGVILGREVLPDLGFGLSREWRGMLRRRWHTLDELFRSSVSGRSAC